MPKSIFYTADVIFQSHGIIQVRTLAAQSIEVLPSTTKEKIFDEVMEDLESQMRVSFPYAWAHRVKIGLRVSDDINHIAPNLWSDSHEPAEAAEILSFTKHQAA